jgi:phosphonate transport system substrate-binding protein
LIYLKNRAPTEKYNKNNFSGGVAVSIQSSLGLVRCLSMAICLVVTLSTQAACLGDAKAKKIYTFDVVPQLNATQTFTVWSPLLQRVGLQTGLCFELRMSPSIPEFEQKLLRGEPEFAYLNPYHEVLAYKKHKYNPLLAEGKDLLTGILVVRNDSNVSDLNALQGQTLAFPAPNAFAASLLIRAELAKKNINIKPVFVKTHSNVYRTVISKDYLAGGGVNNTLTSEPAEVRQQLRVLYETQAYTPHPIVTHPSVPNEVRQRFLNAVLKLGRDDEGQKMLASIRMEHPHAVNYEDHFKPLELLQLEKFLVLAGQ